MLQQRYEAIDNLLAQRRKELGDRQLAEDEVLRSVVIKLLLSDPLRTGTWMLKKVLTLFSAFSQTYSTNEYTTASRRLLAAVSFYPVLALALLGAGLGLPRWRELALIYLVPGAVILSYALLVACTRFRLAVDPYLIMFASLALSRGWALVPVGRSAEARGGFPCDPDEHALAWQRSETHRGEGGGHRGSPH